MKRKSSQGSRTSPSQAKAVLATKSPPSRNQHEADQLKLLIKQSPPADHKNNVVIQQQHPDRQAEVKQTIPAEVKVTPVQQPPKSVLKPQKRIEKPRVQQSSDGKKQQEHSNNVIKHNTVAKKQENSPSVLKQEKQGTNALKQNKKGTDALKQEQQYVEVSKQKQMGPDMSKMKQKGIDVQKQKQPDTDVSKHKQRQEESHVLKPKQKDTDMSKLKKTNVLNLKQQVTNLPKAKQQGTKVLKLKEQDANVLKQKKHGTDVPKQNQASSNALKQELPSTNVLNKAQPGTAILKQKQYPKETLEKQQKLHGTSTQDLSQAGLVLEVERLRAALHSEQGRCQEMGRVVTYLEKAKESLEKERVAEVVKIQEDLSGKLMVEQSGRKKAEQRLEVLETGLAEGRKEEFMKLEETLKSVEMASNKQLAEKEETIQETTEKLERSEGQLASLLDTFNIKELAWKTEKGSGLKQLKAALDNVARLEEAEIQEKERRKKFEEKIKMLEKSLKAQRSEKKPKDAILKDKNAKLEDKLKEVYALLKEEKNKFTNLENSVASMEKSIMQTEAKLASVEAEKQKLTDEKVNKAMATKAALSKLEASTKTANDAKAEAEKKKAAANKRLEELESKLADTNSEAEEAKHKLLEMEIDCTEAVSKYKEVQELKAETDMKYLKVEREGGEMKKLCDQHRDKYEYSVSNKTRYEYRINYLEEQVRRLTCQQGGPAPPGPLDTIASGPPTPPGPPTLAAGPPAPAPGPLLTPSLLPSQPPGPRVHPSVDESVGLLDSTAAAKIEELEEKCRDLEARRCQIEEALNDEVNKNEALERSAEEHKKELDELKELKEEKCGPQTILDEARKTEMNLDSATPTVVAFDNVKEDKLKSVTERENKLVGTIEALKLQVETLKAGVSWGNITNDVKDELIDDDEVLESKKQREVLEEELADLIWRSVEPELEQSRKRKMGSTDGKQEDAVEISRSQVKKCRVSIRKLQTAEMEKLSVQTAACTTGEKRNRRIGKI